MCCPSLYFLETAVCNQNSETCGMDVMIGAMVWCRLYALHKNSEATVICWYADSDMYHISMTISKLNSSTDISMTGSRALVVQSCKSSDIHLQPCHNEVVFSVGIRHTKISVNSKKYSLLVMSRYVDVQTGFLTVIDVTRSMDTPKEHHFKKPVILDCSTRTKKKINPIS